jgi:hypothetical protein
MSITKQSYVLASLAQIDVKPNPKLYSESACVYSESGVVVPLSPLPQ